MTWPVGPVKYAPPASGPPHVAPPARSTWRRPRHTTSDKPPRRDRDGAVGWQHGWPDGGNGWPDGGSSLRTGHNRGSRGAYTLVVPHPKRTARTARIATTAAGRDGMSDPLATMVAPFKD